MSVVKKIPSEDIKNFVMLYSNAYPGMLINTNEEIEKRVSYFTKIQNDSSSENFYGLYREGQLLGGMLLHDFKMNFHNKIMNVGGLGSVAVEFLHKKEKVAKELVEAYLRHYKDRNANLALLYPFRPDFYMNMGFGYGTKMNQYRLEPGSFPKSSLRKNVCFLDESDKKNIIDCYNYYVYNHHGMIELKERESENMFKNPNLKVVGYKINQKLEGFMFFSFKPDKSNFLQNDMVIHRLVYNTRDALKGMFSFLYSQLDQIRHVFINTQEESLYHILQNPMNDSNQIIPPVYHETNTQGVGLMYRVIDTKGLFMDLKEFNFNHVSCLLKLSIHDNFVEENNKSLYIEFIDGYAQVTNEKEFDVEISMNIAEFSSLIMGVVSFKSLYDYSLADISDISYLEKINKLFAFSEKPICMTGF
ncbi:GNAT family N-acetyltransferase [Mycoplasmatota bacterium]|nr:GNAT family N-acetyltransferase [Mycoplasmatota bacterium]